MEGVNLWSNVALWNGVWSLMGGIAVVLAKGWIDRRRDDRLKRSKDAELIHMTEDRFREALAKRLSDCEAGYDRVEKENMELQRKNIANEKVISRLEWTVEKLCEEMKRLDPEFDTTVCEPQFFTKDRE